MTTPVPAGPTPAPAPVPQPQPPAAPPAPAAPNPITDPIGTISPVGPIQGVQATTDDPPAKPKKPAKREIIDVKSEFVEQDKNKDGKLAKTEMKLGKTKFVAYDKDKDGKVEQAEYRAGQRMDRSFKGLDGDHDGKLSTEEMKDLRRHTTEDEVKFDADGDGSVDKQEFHAAIREEVRANRDARREQEWKKLTPAEKKDLERYDTDDDGKVELEEFENGKHKDWVHGREKKRDALFEAAGAKDGKLKVEDAKKYRSYDADEDGIVTKDEFHKGFMADRKAYWEATRMQGEIPGFLKRRLGLDKNGFGLNQILKPKETHEGTEAKATHGKEKTTQTDHGPMVQREGGMVSTRIADRYDKLVALAKKDGVHLSIESGFRTYDEQKALYAKYGPGRAAPPGQSNHEDGNAVDFKNSPGAWDWLAKHAAQHGMYNLPGEPWHYSINGH